MALMNFSLPFGAISQPWGATISPLRPVQQVASSTNSLLYSPADHQQREDDNLEPPTIGSDYYKNNPYAPPQLHQDPHTYQNSKHNDNNNNNNNNNKHKTFNTYLPPIPPPGMVRSTLYRPQQQPNFDSVQKAQDVNNNRIVYKSTSSTSSDRIYGEGTYSRIASVSDQNKHTQTTQQTVFNSYSATRTTNVTPVSSFNSRSSQQNPVTHQQNENKVETSAVNFGASASTINMPNNDEIQPNYPESHPTFTRVQAGQGSRTQVHAVLDYDIDNDEEYFDAEEHHNEEKSSDVHGVTPIQGPLYVKNDTSVPAIQVLSHPKLNNGSFVQIPIWWTALSVALGLDVRGDIIKGVPCVKRYHQLFCPTAGNSYPIEKIERFIDDNKALMRRMYGDFEMGVDTNGPKDQTKKRKRRFIDQPELFMPADALFDNDFNFKTDIHPIETGESYFGKLRNKRQANGNQNRNTNRLGPNGGNNSDRSNNSGTGRLDACESKIEIITPYWASNSAGKIRAIVNTQHFEQAIHQEVCSKTQTSRCDGECGCEQKYKWHRLLAYDPDNDCKGIFMDWFLFPSCCVCRCNPR